MSLNVSRENVFLGDPPNKTKETKSTSKGESINKFENTIEDTSKYLKKEDFKVVRDTILICPKPFVGGPMNPIDIRFVDKDKEVLKKEETGTCDPNREKKDSAAEELKKKPSDKEIKNAIEKHIFPELSPEELKNNKKLLKPIPDICPPPPSEPDPRLEELKKKPSKKNLEKSIEPVRKFINHPVFTCIDIAPRKETFPGEEEATKKLIEEAKKRGFSDFDELIKKAKKTN